MSSSCMRGQNFTAEEERRTADWFVSSLAARPDDFELTEYVIRDRRSGIEIWIANDTAFIRVYNPVKSGVFENRQARRIWEAAHDFRERRGTAESRQIMALLDQHPAPPRTEPEVAKLRRLVEAVPLPVRVAAFCSLIVGATFAAIGLI